MVSVLLSVAMIIHQHLVPCSTVQEGDLELQRCHIVFVRRHLQIYWATLVLQTIGIKLDSFNEVVYVGIFIGPGKDKQPRRRGLRSPPRLPPPVRHCRSPPPQLPHSARRSSTIGTSCYWPKAIL